MNTLLSYFANPWFCAFAIIFGFILLVYGADWLVDGASAIAKQMGVSDLIIGLTVVAFGTSMPEFIVSILAAAEHNTEIAITNILGSNSINIFVILGLSALIYPISSEKSSRHFDIPWSLLAGVLVLFFAIYTRPVSIGWGNFGEFSFQRGFISGIGGTVLLLCFVIFLWHSLHLAHHSSDEQTKNETSSSFLKALLLIAVGLGGLVLGGELIVRSATSIASMMGVSDAIIGLTIVALGTSLPELATSCIAAYKHNTNLALGNVIGSNIFNVFFILGTSALVHPLPTYDGLLLDAAMVTLSSLLVMTFVYSTSKHEIKRWHGGVLLLVYAIYLSYRILSL
ncbi:MAG: calcium/sodium antiporter [Paludibacteraceae bacterium]|nr:calcium/sodium antiporter [Paludibacteraceae bacterium]